jgi:photosystem II stability/assembly factor-like uncharacterized protein
MQRFILILQFIFVFKAVSAQYFYPDPQINVSDSNLPEWVKEMYSSNPDVFAVDAGRNRYFEVRGNKHDVYTRWYKRWRRYISPFVNEKGRIVMPSLAERLASSNRNSANRDAGEWSFLGPNQHFSSKYNDSDPHVLISEQANVYCFDRCAAAPDILYCGTESGGVYKSIDGAQSWTYATKNLSIETVTAIAVSPADPNLVIFSSSGEIWRSIDGASTWNISGDAAFQALNVQVWQFAWHPQNASVLFAGTNLGLFRSDDAGNSWTQIFTGECMSVCFKPNDAQSMYALRYNATTRIADFYKSVDGGTTFTVRPEGWFEVPAADAGLIESLGGRIAVTEANPERVYVLLVGSSQASANLQLAGTIGVYSSSNAGETWSFPHAQMGMPYDQATHPNLMDFDGQSSDYNQIYYNTAFACSQLDETRLLIGGLNLWRSEDGGTSYTPVGGYIGDLPLMHVDLQEFQVYKTGANTEEFWFSSDGGLNVSNDWASSHESRTEGIGAVNFWGIDQGWNQDILVGGRYHNGNAASNTHYGSGNFLALGGGEAPTGYVNYSPEQKTYFSDINGRILPDSFDGIVRGFDMNTDPNESYYDNASSRVLFDPNYWNVAYLGKDNQLYKSTDGGSSFGPIYTFTANINDDVLWIEQGQSNSNIFYVQVLVNNISRLYKSTDGGLTFAQLSLPLTKRELYFTIGYADASELWLGFPGGSNGNKVYKSTDGGATWQNWSTAQLDGLNIKAIAHQAGTNGGVYVAGLRDLVYYRDNAMNDWIEVGTGLPAASYPLRILPFYKKNKLRLGMWNIGIWENDLEVESEIIAGFASNFRNFTCPGDTIWFTDRSVSPDGATLQWSFPGGIPSASSEQSPKVVYATTGSFDVSLIVSYNGISDTITRSVFIESLPAANYPIEEAFESGLLAQGWSLIDDGNDGQNWIITDLASGFGNGDRSVFFDNYYIDVQGKRDMFVTAPALQADASNPVNLFFDVAYARYAVNYSDTLAIYISEDCGQTRTLVYLKGGEELATAPDFSSDRWVPSSSEWRTESISDLPLNFSGDLSVLFENRGRYGQPIYIDNIRLESATGGIPEKGANAITLFPNPTSDQFYLRIENEVGDLWVSISDISGRNISNQRYKRGSSISLEQFPDGMYTVKLTNHQLSHVFKVIKQ